MPALVSLILNLNGPTMCQFRTVIENSCVIGSPITRLWNLVFPYNPGIGCWLIER